MRRITLSREIYQPQVSQINSTVTPEQGVVDSGAVQLFTDVAQVATEATFAFTRQEELSELRGTFDKIVQARQQGGDSTKLQLRARAALDKAKANTPWAAQEADALFRSTFSGGGSGGVFSKTPEEKAQEAHLQKVEETRLALGLSSAEEAQKRITLEENAKSAKIMADSQKEVRNYNSELVFSNTQTQLNNQSIKFMDAMNRMINTGGGSLSADNVRSINLTVDQEALRLRQELNAQTRDPKTGHLLISKDGYETNLKEIEDWAAETKAMAADQGYLKLIQELNSEQSAEINFVANQKYRTLKELEAGGGQAAVKAFLDIAMQPEGTKKEFLKKFSNPVVQEMFKQQGSFKEASSTGFDKLVLPTPNNIFMTEAEAYATGTELNDPRNSVLLTAILDGLTTGIGNVDPYMSMIKKNPDSSALTWSDRFKSWAASNKGKAKTALDATVQSLRTSFLSAYVSENSSLPTDLEVVDIEGTDVGTGRNRRNVRNVTRRNVVRGTGVSPESGKIISNMLSVFVHNPDFAKQTASDLGMAGATPHELVKAVIMGAPEEAPEETTSESGASVPAKVQEAPVEPVEEPKEDLNAIALERYKSAIERANTPLLRSEVDKAFLNGFFKRAEDGGVNLPPKGESSQSPK